MCLDDELKDRKQTPEKFMCLGPVTPKAHLAMGNNCSFVSELLVADKAIEDGKPLLLAQSPAAEATAAARLLGLKPWHQFLF